MCINCDVLEQLSSSIQSSQSLLFRLECRLIKRSATRTLFMVCDYSSVGITTVKSIIVMLEDNMVAHYHPVTVYNNININQYSGHLNNDHEQTTATCVVERVGLWDYSPT